MAASTQSALESIERRRVQLQESVDKLRKALMHWTTWEAEYQFLQEELRSAEDASPAQIRSIAKDLDSSLLNEKELEELLGKDSQTKRTANQVVDLISRRIDYVQQNSATIEKQLDAAEKKLAGADVLLEPGVENEEGLPMMDIEEELDEEGNEVSSSVNQTGKAAAEIVHVLRKAGLQKAELEKQAADQAPEESLDDTEASPAPTAPIKATASTTETKQKVPPVDEAGHVSLLQESSANDSEPPAAQEKTALEQEGYNDALADVNWTKGTKVIELDQDDNELASYPIIPQGESPEDAELRRQMLQYGLSEVGQIVAELDLDHPTADFGDDDDDEADYEYATEDEEDEDEYGRSTRPVVTEDYRKQMLELEKKLNARMMENVGPKTEAISLAEHMGDIRTMRVRKDDQFDESLTPAPADVPKTATKKKGVRFADELDVSEPPRPAPTPTIASEHTRQSTSTISDTIVERSASIPEVPASTVKPTKVSRFKSARTSNQPPQVLPTPALPQPAPVPTGPSGRTLASTVVEHEPSASEPDVPDEFDPALINREIQADYHKARNKFIQQQGGFKPTEEDEERPIVEERDGKTKKVSRFMAARLKADGM